MKYNIFENSRTVSVILFLFGGIGLILVVIFDGLYWRTGVFAEEWPDFTLGHLIRSIIIFVSVLGIFLGMVRSSKAKLVVDEYKWMPLELSSILGSLSASVIILFAFILKPSVFSALSLEDGPIEWGSFLLLFCSCIIIAIAFSKSRNVLSISNATQVSLVLLSFIFFVIAMEEVSWFQRILNIETPKVFGRNAQNEMNLHNFATNYIENIYYFGAFLFLVVLPFIRLFFLFVSSNNYLRVFVPLPFIAVVGSIACAYNFDMWDIIFTQIAFFGCVVILFIFAIFSSSKSEQYMILLAIFVIAVTQIFFLIKGANFSRLSEVTEYKEFFIPLAFFMYSLNVLSSINQVSLHEKS